MSDINYKLNDDVNNFIETIKVVKYKKHYNIINNTNKISDEYKINNTRESLWFINEDAILPYKVLILRDSSVNLMLPFLQILFKDIFLYWDHFKEIDKNLVNFYKPDYVLEIRTERFLNNF